MNLLAIDWKLTTVNSKLKNDQVIISDNKTSRDISVGTINRFYKKNTIAKGIEMN